MKRLLYIFVFMILCITRAQASEWEFVDLDALPYPWCTPCQWTEGIDIADDGSVLVQLGPSGVWPVIVKDGVLTPIVITNGSQSGGTAIAYNGSIAIGMTPLVGSTGGWFGNGSFVSFLNWRPFGLNRQGDIAGDVYTLPASSAAVNGQSIAVSLGGVNSSARAINDNGQVAGNAQQVNGRDHAFLLSSGVVTDLGDLGGGTSQSNAMNNNGAIVGRSVTSNGIHAFLWMQGTMQDLGALGSDSDAYDINDHNVVVGTSGYRAFIWRGAVMEDLNNLVSLPLGWQLISARAINSNGAIVGWGEHQFKKKAFLLRPYGPVPAMKTTWGRVKSLYR